MNLINIMKNRQKIVLLQSKTAEIPNENENTNMKEIME